VHDLGLRIPDDISVIAHDDVFPWLKPENFSVPLTTTRSSIRAAGTRVAERLAARIAGRETEPFGEVWPVELIVGLGRRRAEIRRHRTVFDQRNPKKDRIARTITTNPTR
jgi:DNA-binding LacI/PurR family transcriptional regulator